jgi:hypothetical protein
MQALANRIKRVVLARLGAASGVKAGEGGVSRSRHTNVIRYVNSVQ